MAAPKLSHTIQTTVGMVVGRGGPIQRPFPDRWTESYQHRLDDSLICIVRDAWPAWSSASASIDLFSKCVLEYRIPNFVKYRSERELKRLRYNILACRDGNVDVNFMKRSISSLRRLDLEQVVGVIFSAIMNDSTIPMREEIMHALITGINHPMLAQSCMWMTPANSIGQESTKFSRLVGFARQIISKDVSIGEALDWGTLLPVLLCIRRVRPSDSTRCLFIPLWIFDAANIDPPPDYAIWDANGKTAPGYEPTSPAPVGAIILPRKAFRALQRKLLSHHKFWKSSIDLHKAIRDLESDVIYSASAVKRVLLPSTDTLLVAQYFMTIQRRLQRKIVSDLNGCFLAAGDSNKFIQNTPSIPTAFEIALAKAARQTGAGLPIAGAVLPQIDQCCILMERYVLLYGDGDRTTLVFKLGERGGSGRGPVDEYNLLCKILDGLQTKAKAEGKSAPGPVRKFLAKDIMHYNNSWRDDAFADGFVPGWEPWLKMRRERGVLLSEWEGNDELGEPMVLDGDVVNLPIRSNR